MNAKELILAKINAGSKFVDLYNYLIISGNYFNDIAKTMMSPIFNFLVKSTEDNIFNPITKNYTVDNIINFYLEPTAVIGMNQKIFKGILTKARVSLNLSDIDLNDVNQLKAIRQWVGEYYSNYRSDSGYIEQEYDYTEENNEISIVKLDYLDAYNLLDLKISRAKDLNSLGDTLDYQMDILKKLKSNYLPGVKELQTIGRMAGINQGIKTNDYEKIKYIKNIENFVTDKFIKYNVEFDLMKFLIDPSYKKQMIELYENEKIFVNILDAIDKVPHFKEMFNSLYTDLESIRRLSVKNDLQLKLLNEVSQIGKTIKKDKTGNIQKIYNLNIDKFQFKEITNYINDILIYNWTKTLDKTFIVPNGFTYYEDNKKLISNGDTELKISSPNGLNTFKSLVDNYIIPRLKDDESLKDNEFIKSLTLDIKNIDGQTVSFYKLPLNMMQIDNSEKTRHFYEMILNDFNKLNNVEYDNWNVIDVFYLYNLLFNKDDFGRTTLTRLFEDVIKNKSEGILVKSFYEYLSDLDFDESKRSKIDYNISDLLWRLGIMDDKLSNKFNITKYENHISVKSVRVSYNNDILRIPFLTSNGDNNIEVNTKLRSNLDYYVKGTSSELLKNIIYNKFKNYKNVKFINNDDSEKMSNLNPKIKNAKAFIKEGIVYFNTDMIDVYTPLHEFTHLIIAEWKLNNLNNNKSDYYDLLDKVETLPNYDKYKKLYDHLTGSDLNEEILVNIIEEYFKSNSDLQTIINDSEKLKIIISDIFKLELSEDIKIDELMTSNLHDILSLFLNPEGEYNNRMIDINNVKLNQKIMTYKNKLVKDELLIKECNG